MVFAGYTIIALFYTCLLIICLTHQEGIVSKFMTLSPLRWFGKISYCLYLIHIPILGLLYGLIFGQKPLISNFNEASVTFVALGLSLLVAHFSWEFVERPIVNCGHSFKYN